MEGHNNNNNNKQGVNSVPQKSFTAELFGVSDANSTTPQQGIFASIFPPPSQVVGRNSAEIGCWQKHAPGNQAWPTTKHGSSVLGCEGSRYNKERNSIIPEQRVEPCHLSSSLYYGGQEVYSRTPSTHNASTTYPTFKKDSSEDDPNGSNSAIASRGNWWQGSLYY